MQMSKSEAAARSSNAPMKAFGLSPDEDPTPPPPKPVGKQPEDSDFARIRAKFAQRLGLPPVTDVKPPTDAAP